MKLRDSQDEIRDYLRRNPRPAFRTSPPLLTSLEERVGAELTPHNDTEMLDPIATKARDNYGTWDSQKYDEGRV